MASGVNMKKNYRNILSCSPSSRQSGNVFFAIFGAVALIGLLGASVMTFMKGPLATSVKLTKINTAENQMAIGAQVAVMATTSQGNSGDCDSDTYVEPMPWRAATTEPHPVDGGLIPLSLGISKKDPWGTEYGYCVWNHGATTSGSGCGANMLAGTNSTAYPVVALVSAGPDKTFTTTCRTFAAADANSDGDLDDAGDSPLVSKAADTDDDIIFTYTYQEATASSGGLWSLKSGDPTTATIGKKIEASGTASLKGGVLLPDKSLVTCDASTAGVMAMNGNAIEICDGAGHWTAITGGGGGGGGSGLILSPNVSNGMNITAPCGNATCYSSNVTFTLTNNLSPAAVSDNLVVTLSNTNNFEKVSDNCNGQTLAPSAACQIVVRAKATGNRSYSSTLQITGNNSPLAMLDGTASGFGCTVGGDAPGGKYAACNIGGYNLVITPSGCTASTSNPTCGGGVDTISLAASSIAPTFMTTCCTSNGQQNSANLAGYSGGAYTFPAANQCEALEYGGYDDWFLPSSTELQSYLYANKATLGSASAGSYWSSREGTLSSNFWTSMNIATGALTSTSAGTTMYYVRCMRWDPVKIVAATPDSVPVNVVFTPSTSTIAGETRTSNTVTVYGVSAPVTVSVSGGTGAKFSKNGGAYTAPSTTVTNGDTISLQATSPVAGQEDTISLTIGSSSFSWKVRTSANNTIYAFVTKNFPSVSTGIVTADITLTGADTLCNAQAAAGGLSGSWVAMLAQGNGSTDGPANRIPWNWTTLKNMNNQVVATSYADFTDGTWASAINRTSDNGTTAATYAWTGANDNTGVPPFSSANNNCAYWTTASGGLTASYGAINSLASSLYSGSTTCNQSLALYCIQDPGSALIDTDPAAVSLAPGVAYSAGATASSNTVTVTSILQPVTVTITPSAGTADIYLNGVAQGATSILAPPNSTLKFSLTVPTVLGTKNTATIQIGDDTYSWWAGYADSAKVAHVFVTSLSYRADTQNTGGYYGLQGIAGADNRCKERAAAAPASYGLSQDWIAMLSTTTQSMASRIPWNWGRLETVNGTVIADGGYVDLLDGTIDNPITTTEIGTTSSATLVWSGSKSDGSAFSTDMEVMCYNWTNPNPAGITGSPLQVSSSWIFSGSAWCSTAQPIYCIENVDVATDTTPTLSVPYIVQVPTGSRQSSGAVIVSGMSVGASTTLSVTGAGTPTFTVNGGAEVTSASVHDGDSLVFKMDAPASGNSSNKMTIKADGTTITYWRVWTGDVSGTAVKRVFVSTDISASTNSSGITGLDTYCQNKATAAGIGGTWKAIASGNNESDYAVNRIGYNWSILRRIDGVDVVYAGNLWKTATSPLLAPIAVTETGVVSSVDFVATATTATGAGRLGETPYAACAGYMVSSGVDYLAPYDIYKGSSGITSSAWVDNGNTISASWGAPSCGTTHIHYLYCIEQ